MTEKHLESGSLAWVMLGHQPRSDHKLLIAAREEGAVHSKVPFRFPNASTDTELKDALDRTHKLTRDNYARYPDVSWWTFDPETRRFARESPPLNFTNRITNETELEKFRFRIKANGNLTLVNKPEK